MNRYIFLQEAKLGSGFVGRHLRFPGVAVDGRKVDQWAPFHDNRDTESDRPKGHSDSSSFARRMDCSAVDLVEAELSEESLRCLEIQTHCRFLAIGSVAKRWAAASSTAASSVAGEFALKNEDWLLVLPAAEHWLDDSLGWDELAVGTKPQSEIRFHI